MAGDLFTHRPVSVTKSPCHPVTLSSTVRTSRSISRLVNFANRPLAADQIIRAAKHQTAMPKPANISIESCRPGKVRSENSRNGSQPNT